jgi:hypothetical protein
MSNEPNRRDLGNAAINKFCSLRAKRIFDKFATQLATSRFSTKVMASVENYLMYLEVNK